jgi:HEPN domain-containing protein
MEFFYMQDNNTAQALEWIQFAKSDFSVAISSFGTENVLLNSLCFHCQQAVEKSLKAILIKRNVKFNWTHNLKNLIDSLPSEYEIPPAINESVKLTDYAVSMRYPGDYEEITEEDYKEAIQLASFAIHWAEEIVNGLL